MSQAEGRDELSKSANIGQGTRFMLADWQVDTSANRLHRQDSEIKLESRVMAVLLHLLRHPGELVTREDLEQAVWGRTVVGYDALTRCIAKLRKALEDDPRKPRFIETISKKGYRLIAPVTDQAGEDTHQTAVISQTLAARTRPKPWLQRRLIWLIAGILVINLFILGITQLLETNAPPALHPDIEGRPLIVVLPFTNLSDDQNQAYFSDGITADIGTALSKLSGLFVIAQSSANSYRDRSLDLSQIADKLGVRYVLEGSVRRTGNRLRVNVSLVDADSKGYLWSERYDRELQNIFDVQDDITAHIIDTLSIKLTEAEKRRTARRYTESLAAYDDFLHGQALYFRHTREANEQARQRFQQAIDRDDRFSRAYGAMALTYVDEHRNGWNTKSTLLDQALQLATQAVVLDDELPQAHWVLGYVHLFRREYEQAAAAAERAIELHPNFPDSHLILAVCNIHLGKAAQATRLVRKAMLLNPSHPAAYASVLGQALFFTGQYEAAVVVLREATERNINLRTAHVFLIVALSKLEQLDEANWAAGQLRLVDPGFSVDHAEELLPIQEGGVVEDIKERLRRSGL